MGCESPAGRSANLNRSAERIILGPSTLAKGVNPLADIKGDLFDISAEIEPAHSKQVTLAIRGTPLEYDAEKKELKLLGKTAPLAADSTASSGLRILVDRSSIEVFAERRARHDVVLLHPLA